MRALHSTLCSCVLVALCAGACQVASSGANPGGGVSADAATSSSSGGPADSGSADATVGADGPTGDGPAQAGTDATATDSGGSDGGGKDGGGMDGGGMDAGASPDGAGAGGDAAASATGFLAELDVFLNGGTIPAADGIGAITVTVDAGGPTTVSIAGASGTERVHIDWTSPGSYALTADQNADGKVDEQMTTTTSGDVVTTLWQKDRGFAGNFDWSDTMTWSNTATSSYIQEILPGQTTMQATSSYSDSPVQETWCTGFQFGPGEACDAILAASGVCTACFPPKPSFCAPGAQPPPQPCTDDCPPTGGSAFAANIPSTDTSPVPIPTSLPNVHFYAMTQGAWACTPSQIAVLGAAVAAGGTDFRRYVGPLNQTFYGAVMTALAHSPVYYGCFDSDAGGGPDAQTGTSGFTDAPSSYITAVNDDILAWPNGPADPMEVVVVHEWFHLVFTHQIDRAGSLQRDFIYSCSRVANQCKAYSAQFYEGICCDASSTRDFDMCADGAHKGQFGIQGIFVEVAGGGYFETPTQGDQDLPSSCTDGTSGVAECDCSLEEVPAYCDGTILSEAQGLALPSPGNSDTLRSVNCCESCPAGKPYPVGDPAKACGTTTGGTKWPGPNLCGQGLSPPPPLGAPDAGAGPFCGTAYATGPTYPWRAATAAIWAGQAVGMTNGPNTKDTCDWVRAGSPPQPPNDCPY